MNEHEITKKLAYAYYEKFNSYGYPSDPQRDWLLAEHAIAHFKDKYDKEDFFWRLREEDYQELRPIYENARDTA